MKQLPTNPQWTDEALDEYRQQVDPSADKVIRKIMSGGAKEKIEINQLFKKLVRNDFENDGKWPEVVAKYFEEWSELPEWADPEKIKIGENLFNQFGPECVMVLFCKSLPECYLGWKGAEVLYQTGRLTNPDPKQLQRRVVETAQFVLNVMAPNAFTKDKQGVITPLKVRLIHASIRFYLKKRGEWDFNKFDQPINQEDLVATILAFSLLTLNGLEKTCVHLSEQQKEAFMHTWMVVGYFIGIDQKLAPKNYLEAKELWAILERRLFGKSDAGIALNHSLLSFIRYVIPGTLADVLPEIYMRHLIHKQYWEMIEIPANKNLFGHLIWMMTKTLFFFGNLTRFFPVTRWILRLINRRMMQKLILHWNEDKRIHFYIPPSLQKDWKIKSLT